MNFVKRTIIIFDEEYHGKAMQKMINWIGNNVDENLADQSANNHYIELRLVESTL